MNKIDAISEAKKAAKKNGFGWAYAVELPNGEWVVYYNKPMLRTGKVIEVDEDGIERFG